MESSRVFRLTQAVKTLALDNHVDYAGVASIERFSRAPEGHRPGDLLPGAQSVVSLGTRINKGPQLTQQIALRDRSMRHVAFSYRWLGYGLINMYINDRAALSRCEAARGTRPHGAAYRGKRCGRCPPHDGSLFKPARGRGCRPWRDRLERTLPDP